jgi:hypothetical protein
MEWLHEINAFIKEGDELMPFYLKISEPTRNPAAKDYYCTIHAPALLNRDKNIYGVDRSQARALTLQFVKQLLGNKRLFDKDGNPVALNLD